MGAVGEVQEVVVEEWDLSYSPVELVLQAATQDRVLQRDVSNPAQQQQDNHLEVGREGGMGGLLQKVGCHHEDLHCDECRNCVLLCFPHFVTNFAQSKISLVAWVSIPLCPDPLCTRAWRPPSQSTY